eukprot:1161423-Pelagomonas_calceolata.AAC.13
MEATGMSQVQIYLLYCDVVVMWCASSVLACTLRMHTEAAGTSQVHTYNVAWHAACISACICLLRLLTLVHACMLAGGGAADAALAAICQWQ